MASEGMIGIWPGVTVEGRPDGAKDMSATIDSQHKGDPDSSSPHCGRALGPCHLCKTQRAATVWLLGKYIPHDIIAVMINSILVL